MMQIEQNDVDDDRNIIQIYNINVYLYYIQELQEVITNLPLLIIIIITNYQNQPSSRITPFENQIRLDHFLQTMLNNHEQQELELNSIISETFANNTYTDKQIDNLIHNPKQSPFIKLADLTQNSYDKKENSIEGISGRSQENNSNRDSLKSRKNSTHSKGESLDQNNLFNPYANDSQSVEQNCNNNNNDLDQCQHQFQQQSELLIKSKQQKEIIKSYSQIYEELSYYSQPLSYNQIQKQFPLYLLSKPTYKISPEVNIHQKIINFSQALNRKNIQLVDVGYCHQEKLFKMAIGTDSCVAIYRIGSVTPIQILQPFSNVNKDKQNGKIMALKWSQNMQYLIIANDLTQVKLFQFKQSIQIQNSLSWRVLKNPIQVYYLAKPKLKFSIIQCLFLYQDLINNNPRILLIDQEYEIYKVSMKKNILNFKPFVQTLPVRFNQFFQIVSKKVFDQFGNIGTLIAIGGEGYVTLAKLQPQFQILLVYDKQKHGTNLKKNGYSHISFLKNDSNQFYKQSSINFETSSELMIVWDKYCQILIIKIDQLSPMKYKIQTKLKYIFPDSSILIGPLSNTLIYQISRIGLKIYSLSQLSKYQNLNQLQNNKFGSFIHDKKISFSDFPYGYKLQQAMSNMVVQIDNLRILNGLIVSYNHTLFITFNSYIYQVSIQEITSYLENIIQNISNWKIGLQIVNDSIMRQLTCFDGLQQKKLKKSLKQYSLRYIDFLQGIIDRKNPQNSKIWQQELYFLFNILIDCQCQDFVMNELCIKLYRLSPNLLSNFQPFVLNQRLTHISSETLQLIFSILPLRISKRLVFNLFPIHNKNYNQKQFQSSIDTMHSINGSLARWQMWLELIWVNNMGGDWYTPFVLFLSTYQKNSTSNSTVQQLQFSQSSQSQLIQNKNLIPSQEVIQQQQQLNFQIQKQNQKQKQKQNNNQFSLAKLLSFQSFSLLYRINNLHLHKNHSSINNNNNQSSRIEIFLNQYSQQLQQVRPKYLLQIFLPLAQSIFSILLKSHLQKDLFNLIITQLFQGKCLELLNQIDNHLDYDYLTHIINLISYQSVIEHNYQEEYWVMISKLMIRKIIKVQMYVGISYLTLEVNYKPQLLDRLVRECWIVLYQEFHHISKQNKEVFFQKILKVDNNYIQLLKLLGDQLNRQIDVLHAMIACPKYHNTELIQYVQEIITLQTLKQPGQINIQKNDQNSPQSKKKQERTSPKALKQTISPVLLKLKSILKQKIKLFTQIDSETTSKIITKYFTKQIREFLKYLDQFPLEQLHLLRYILEIKNVYNQQEMVHQKIKLLQLLAKTGNKNQILTYLQNYMFPLDQALKVCQKYQVLDSWAFLLVKSGGQGNVALAIELYFKIIKKAIESANLHYQIQYSKVWQELIKQMLKNMRMCIKICTDLDLKGNYHYQKQWFLIISQLQTLKTFIYHNYSSYVQEQLKDIINDILYPQLIHSLLSEVTHQNIVHYLDKSINQFQVQAVKLIISQMIKNYLFEKSIMKLLQQVFINFQITQRQQIVTKQKKGFLSKSRCYQCLRKNRDILIHYYSCGHEIHPYCNEDVKQCLICSEDIDYQVQKIIDSKNLIKTEVFYQPIPIQQSEQDIVKQQIKASMLYKFKQFDYLNTGVDMQILE